MGKDRGRISMNSIVDTASKIALLAMTLLVMMAVILRYFFSIGIRWSDELTNFIFIYIVFLGIPIAYRYDEHVVIKVFANLFPVRVQKILTIMMHIFILIALITISIYGIQIMFGKVGKTLTPGLRIPRAFIYAAVPIGTLFLSFEIIKKLKQLLKRNDSL